MPPALQTALRPRVERLGYLGEFFQCGANQPQALLSFVRFTEELRAALPDRLTEVVALTVASRMGNEYEQYQHERLCRSLGYPEEWVRSVLARRPVGQAALSPEEQAVQALVMALLDRGGREVTAELAAVVAAGGTPAAIGILFLTGRYVTHALMVNALQLQPPVTSIFARARA